MQTLLITLFLLILLSGALLARHNLRLGRGDRKGAFRLAAFFFVVAMVSSIVSTHHVATLGGEFSLLVNELAFNLMATCMLWLVYIAVEPFVRRRWPGRIISWNRLLAMFFSQFFILMFNFFPITTDLSAWHAGGTIFCLFVASALILFGFKTSLAGQPLFRGSLVDD